MTTRSERRMESLLAKLDRDKAKAEANQPKWFRNYYKDVMLPQGLHDGVCRCGREFRPFNVHCPSCGSSNHLAVGKLSAIIPMPDGTMYWAQGYRCQRCQCAYTDLQQFLYCEAPPPQPTMKVVRQHERANEAIRKAGFTDVDDFKRKLEEYRKKKETDKGKVQ